MSAIPWRGLLTRRGIVLELTLTALACLPVAARQVTREAELSLLLPVVVIAALAAWGLVSLKSSDGAKAWLLALAGPLILFIYVANLSEAAWVAARETLLMLPQAAHWLYDWTSMDATAWLGALNALSIRVSVPLVRTGTWLIQVAQGNAVEDPAARALAWSAGLWWLAAWASWHVRRRGEALLGLLPVTALIGVLANSQHRQMALFWIHLGALLLLLGTLNYERRVRAWEGLSRDYAEFTSFYSLLSSVAIAGLLLGSAYLSSTTSIKDFLDKLREERRSAAAQREPGPGELERSPQRNVTASMQELLAPHRITGGPELSHDVYMEISTGELPPMPWAAHPQPAHYYWRTASYDIYTGTGWGNSDTAVNDVQGGKTLLAEAPERYRLVHQQVVFPSGSTGRLYWTDTLLRVDVPIQTARRTGIPIGKDPLEESSLISAFSTADRYSADSLRLIANEENLRSAPAIYSDWIRNRYLQLPDAVPERVRALARTITAAAPTSYDRALAIEAYLRGFPYTLDAPAPPPWRDAADYFLFDLKKGHCDYYATAMVVLSRAAGLPARFVTGFASGSYDPEAAKYIVTQADAHAWAEIYFPGNGWVEFEPTPSQPLPYRPGQTKLEGPHPGAQQSPNPIQQVLEAGTRFRFLIWPAVSAAALLLVFGASASDWLLARLHPERALPHFFHGMRKTARPLTGPVLPSQTAHEYTRELACRIGELRAEWHLARWLVPAPEELNGLTELYARALFTTRTPVRAEALHAARIWARLRWRLVVLGMINRIKRGTGQGGNINKHAALKT